MRQKRRFCLADLVRQVLDNTGVGYWGSEEALQLKTEMYSFTVLVHSFVLKSIDKPDKPGIGPLW